MSTIVVGLDESKGAREAARWTAKQAQQSGAHVIAVHAVPRSGLWMMDAIQLNTDALLAQLQEQLAGRWVAPLRKAKIPYETQLIRGDPAFELLRVAKRARASMLVLGSKGHSSLTDLVVGGTVHKVINRSNIPVVLVPSVAPPRKAASPRAGTGSRTSK